MRKVVAVSLMTLGAAAMASAAFTSPEIDPGSGMSAIALLSAAVIIYRGRRKK